MMKISTVFIQLKVLQHKQHFQSYIGNHDGRWTILDDVPLYPVGQSVSDTGRPGQKWWKTDLSIL